MKFLVNITEVGEDGNVLYVGFGILCGIFTWFAIHDQPWTHSTLGRIGEILVVAASVVAGPAIVVLALILGIIGALVYAAYHICLWINNG